ncbi:hypothetical protein [uncultured Flavobacterium sp.]|uniref:hypothetical protein n=1 Tax=uncultured Flavobacterium sp. TaxID=165435 RepID=UPI0030CA19B8
MNLTIKTPEFITDLMKLWLLQYKETQQDNITQLGIFHWEFLPNRRNPDKPRRIPRIDFFEVLKEETFKRNIYFLEIDDKTLHVFESSGLDLAGLNVAHKYDWDGKQFYNAPKKIWSMIR